MSKLELYNIYAGYEESKPVLKDISFFVEKGEFIVLLGTSGCGKTTILNLIAGMIPISAGELNVKYPEGIKLQKRLLEEEGHTIISKGTKNIKYYVKDFENSLIEL